jgi:TonB family protein
LKIAAFVSACASLHAPAFAADDPVTLESDTPWIVNFAPDKCRLSSQFGDEDNRHYLFFEQHYPSRMAGMTIAGPALKRFRSRRQTALRFYDGQEELETEPFTGEVDTIGNAVIYPMVHVKGGTGSFESNITGLARLDIELADKVEYVAVRQRGREVRFETGPLGEAFKVLNTCTQDLVREWGLDVERHLTAQKMPKWLNAERISGRISRDYPTSALYRGEQAILRMRVIVGEDGRVERCEIGEATKTKRLKSPACAEMENARFEPAKDAEGQPFRSYYATSLRYMIDR